MTYGTFYDTINIIILLLIKDVHKKEVKSAVKRKSQRAKSPNEIVLFMERFIAKN